MKIKFIRKHIQKDTPIAPKEEIKPILMTKGSNNKKEKHKKDMDIEEIEMLAKGLTADETTKKIKKDRGLIERTESSKIMITEDNKQLLKD